MKILFRPFPVRLALATAFLAFNAAAIYAQSMPGYQAPAKPRPREESLQTKAARGQAPLRKLFEHLQPDVDKTKRLPALKANEKDAKAKNKALRIGAVRDLPDPIDSASDAVSYKISEGDVRVMSVVSEGALYTRVQFSDMALPAGARVFVYSMANPDEFYGPYEGRGPSEHGTFWTPPMKGDGVVIEYFAPATVTSGIPFKVSKISHVYKDPTNLKVGGCHNDVAAPWTETAKSVGRLDFVSGGGVFLCTGTLMADEVPASDIPYVLTASHCFDTQAEAQSLRVWWNYNSGDSPPPGTPRTDGANLLATGLESDFTFVRLTGLLPGGLFFSGWDASIFTGSTDGTAIHHPDGTYKRISFGTARQPSTGECPAGLQCLFVDWNRTANPGVTEPGSSGSGLWKGLPTDPSGAKLIGTLTGGESACGAPPASLNDFYGRFSVTYPHVASYLTGTGTSCSASPITVGQTINGALDVSDCQHQHRGGSFADLYSFSGSAGQQVAVSMTASFDTYLYLMGPSGVIVASNDDSGGTLNSRIPPGSGFFTLPASGTYTIEATSFNPNVTGSYTLTLSERPTRTLTVTSSNPNSGVTVGVSVFDNNGQSTGTTQFTRIYNQNTSVTLTAHPTSGKIFQEWRKDGVFHSSSMNANVTMDVDHTMTAVYRDPNVYTLTVASSNPNSGVGIGVIPNDNNGQSSGTTQFTRNYNEIVVVGLNAPLTAPGGNVFQKWQRNGVDYDSNQSTTVQMNGSPTTITMTVVYVAPQIFTLTVASSNPNSGVNITVSPNDNGGFGNGATQFSRTYNQYTNVVLTAPAAAGNGNVFDRWLVDGITTFNSTVNVFMSGNRNAIAVYLTKPVIFIEEGTVNTAAALDSVTFVRGPFRLLDPYNFSSDQRTRLILFTSDLGLTQADLSNPAVLVVDVPGFNFPVQNVGSLTGVPGLTGSYIVVRLPDGLTAGAHNLRIRLRGVTSDARTLNIVQ